MEQYPLSYRPGFSPHRHWAVYPLGNEVNAVDASAFLASSSFKPDDFSSTDFSISFLNGCFLPAGFRCFCRYPSGSSAILLPAAPVWFAR
jgi:hypothetical protein